MSTAFVGTLKTKKEIRKDGDLSRRGRQKASKEYTPLEPKFGKVYTYRIFAPDDLGLGKGLLFIDQGFACYRYFAGYYARRFAVRFFPYVHRENLRY